MTNSLKKCNAEETAACCCVDVGTVIDNTDCVASYDATFQSESDAQNALARLTEEANKIASEPCKIKSKIEAIEGGFRLVIDVEFCCQAECMIFQLALR